MSRSIWILCFFSSVVWSVLFLCFTIYHFKNVPHSVSALFCLFHHPSLPWHTCIQLSNGFDHYSPATSPYLHSNGGSSGSGTATAFPFFPASSSSSTSPSSPTRSWSRPASALLPDYPPYCTLGPMIPSSRVPSWKVCSSPWSR